MVITGTNAVAESHGIETGMVLADARAVTPELIAQNDQPMLTEKLLRRLAEWCIRFTPVAAVDLPDGIILDCTGCAHLWGGELKYVSEVVKKLKARGYGVRAAIADTHAVAWAVARFGEAVSVIPPGGDVEALHPLPPESLRLEAEAVERLHKLGLHQVRQFMNIPRPTLRRRFGQHLIARINCALGKQDEPLTPVQPVEPYQERLPCMEPIATAKGIEIAMEQLLTSLCMRLQQHQKGLRYATFKCYRVDGKTEQIHIATSKASHHVRHLFKLFELKISSIEPGLGIELFVLEANKVEDYLPRQEKMWRATGGLEDDRLSELIDRLSGKAGVESISRFVPDEHYWPERSFKPASSLDEKLTTSWRSDRLRPLLLLKKPEAIEVTAPIPDYPPMLFRYKGELHKIVRADGPERIEQEWWIQQGQHRDYYRVEDEEGNRYWLFRLGHYHDRSYRWYLHGFFP
jgi:protein ImuB